MTYCTTQDVYRTAGITKTEISEVDVLQQIYEAEAEVCKITRNIYWKVELDSQTATSSTADTIVVSTSTWSTNCYANMYVWLYSGTGSIQLRKILSNTSTTLTVDRDWTTTNPSTDSLFRIFYIPNGFDPYVSDSYDGNGVNYFFLPYFPVKKVETLTLNSTVVTPSNLYVWEKIGKLQLKNTAEYSKFNNSLPQDVVITYWYGVDSLPYVIKRLVELKTSIQILGQQMGGTFDDPSMVTLPEASVSIGQAYINIKGALEVLREEYNDLVNKYAPCYPVFG